MAASLFVPAVLSCSGNTLLTTPDTANFSAIVGAPEDLPETLAERFSRSIGVGFASIEVGSAAGTSVYLASGMETICIGMTRDSQSTSTCADVAEPHETRAVLALENPNAHTVLVVAVPDGYTEAHLGTLLCPIRKNAAVFINPDMSQTITLEGPSMQQWRLEGQVGAPPSAGDPGCLDE